jgi:SnoaL-like protein
MDVHPYRTAWQTRDIEAWAQSLAPDVVLHSPIVRQPFRGREAAIELFGVLFDELGEMCITDELVDGETHAFFWTVQIGVKSVEGVDLLRCNERGEISEIRVLIRPLPDIALFAAAIGPALAAKRAPIRGLVARLMILPLRAILTLADTISARLIQRR